VRNLALKARAEKARESLEREWDEIQDLVIEMRNKERRFIRRARNNGLSDKEIGHIMGVTTTAVWQRRQKLGIN
jgi:DNA-directed RNA polymerase specialized sigma24 family protein